MVILYLPTYARLICHSKYLCQRKTLLTHLFQRFSHSKSCPQQWKAWPAIRRQQSENFSIFYDVTELCLFAFLGMTVLEIVVSQEQLPSLPPPLTFTDCLGPSKFRNGNGSVQQPWRTRFATKSMRQSQMEQQLQSIKCVARSRLPQQAFWHLAPWVRLLETACTLQYECEELSSCVHYSLAAL